MDYKSGVSWERAIKSLGSKQLAERSGRESVQVCQWDGSNQESLGSENNHESLGSESNRGVSR